jgi:hypothetical protein
MNDGILLNEGLELPVGLELRLGIELTLGCELTIGPELTLGLELTVEWIPPPQAQHTSLAVLLSNRGLENELPQISQRFETTNHSQLKKWPRTSYHSSSNKSEQMLVLVKLLLSLAKSFLEDREPPLLAFFATAGSMVRAVASRLFFVEGWWVPWKAILRVSSIADICTRWSTESDPDRDGCSSVSRKIPVSGMPKVSTIFAKSTSPW